MTPRKPRRSSVLAAALALAAAPTPGCGAWGDAPPTDADAEREAGPDTVPLDATGVPAGDRMPPAAADRQFMYAALDAVAAAARGRLGAAADLARAAELRAAELGDPDSALQMAVLPALWHLWATGEADASVATVESALGRYRIGELVPPRRVDLILAAFFADAGQAQRGRAFLSLYVQDASPPAAGRRMPLPSGYHTARGAIGLMERRYAEAIRALERAAAAGSDDPMAPDFRLGLAWERAGARDSAVRAYERFVARHAPELASSRVTRTDAWAVPYALTSLGDLYEALDDKSTAAEYFERFIELWEDADAALQTEVVETRERSRALGGRR